MLRSETFQVCLFLFLMLITGQNSIKQNTQLRNETEDKFLLVPMLLDKKGELFVSNLYFLLISLDNQNPHPAFISMPLQFLEKVTASF